MSKRLLIIIAIILTASILRLWQLGSIPISPDWDEAALGYNAYSILQTGKDEYGQEFPIILKSFGDYKPALYSYLAIPSIILFDLNTFSIRLPSALFGILTVLATYFLVKELLKINSNNSSSINRYSHIPLISALLLAISPWHIQFSRVAFEANIGLAFNVFAVLFFLYGLKKPLLLSISAVMLGLGLYAYQSEKVFIPLLFIVLIGVFFKRLKSISPKFLGLALLTGLLVSLPMVTAMVKDSSNTLGRAKGVSVFSAQSDSFKANTEKVLRDKNNNDLIGQLVDNRRVFYVRQVVENYLSHWDINWLFLTGDIGRHHAPNMGLLYLFELPFIFIGIYSLIFGKYPRDMKKLLLLWFLISPIPASVTTGVPHAVRTLNFLPTFQIFAALGLFEVFQRLSAFNFQPLGLRIKNLLYVVCCLLFAFNILYYLDQYFVQQNFFASEDWQYGYEQAVSETKDLSNEYTKIVVSNNGYLDQSYIFYLFYLKYQPSEYQKNVTFIGQSTTDRRIGKYEFRKIDWSKDKDSQSTLFVGMPSELPSDEQAKWSINFLNGKPAIKIVGT